MSEGEGMVNEASLTEAKPIDAVGLIAEIKGLTDKHTFTLSRFKEGEKAYWAAKTRVDSFDSERHRGAAVSVLDAIYHALQHCEFSSAQFKVFADWAERAWPLLPDIFLEFSRFSDHGSYHRPDKWFTDEFRAAEIEEIDKVRRKAREEADVHITAQKITMDVIRERLRQHARFGRQTLPDGTGGTWREVDRKHAQELADFRAAQGELTWLHVLEEEVAEALAETDPMKLRAELIQVAAVAVQWIEALDRRGSP